MRAERPLVELHLGALVDHRAAVAAEGRAVGLALEEILPHLGADFFEDEAQMREDRIIAQHRMALLHQIAHTDRRQAAEHDQRNREQIARARDAAPSPRGSRRKTAG